MVIVTFSRHASDIVFFVLGPEGFGCCCKELKTKVGRLTVFCGGKDIL